jgi:hypothetical protein
MVFTYVDAATRPNYGTFEAHKKLLDSVSWFPPVKSYVELPRWWSNFCRSINAMLVGAATDIPALIEWYAGNADAYLTQLEDMMLTTVLMSSGKGISQLEVVFTNAGQAATGTKQSSAAYILSGILTEVTAAKTVAVGVARQQVREALSVSQPLSIPEVTAYCAKAQSALSTACSLLSTAEYEGLSHEASYQIAHVFAHTTSNAQWLNTRLGAAGAPRLLHDRLAELVRELTVLQTFAPAAPAFWRRRGCVLGRRQGYAQGQAQSAAVRRVQGRGAHCLAVP